MKRIDASVNTNIQRIKNIVNIITNNISENCLKTLPCNKELGNHY